MSLYWEEGDRLDVSCPPWEPTCTAAQFIHSSSGSRFNITYCPGGLNREEIEGVGFGYADLAGTLARYNPARLHDGFNTVEGEEIFFISHPALGLWASRDRFSAV
jgi:hypothetical protein